MTSKSFVTIFAILACFEVMQAASSKDMKPGFKYPATIVETLQEFAKQRGISESKLADSLFELVVNQPCWRQGGIGMLGNDTYILIDSDKNAIKVSGKLWEGLPNSQSQTVYLDGQKVIEAGALDGKSEPVVIMFSKSKVRFIDYKNKRAGYFRRFPQ
ncbi:MAG: hypothetical protein JSS83_14540 [Cyanobacteria bacterium SZAS LIN-3]|nr:hypothetical protein [Cyanobacteria bacterium SZAS LIN-3]